MGTSIGNAFHPVIDTVKDRSFLTVLCCYELWRKRRKNASKTSLEMIKGNARNRLIANEERIGEKK